MVQKRTLAKTAAVTFGTAMTTMYAAPDLNAELVGITFKPKNTVSYITGTTGRGVTMYTTAGIIGSFLQFNDSSGKNISTQTANKLQSIKSVSAGDTLNPATFNGNTKATIAFTAGATGVVYIGFRSSTGNVGWFSMNLDSDENGTIKYLNGRYGNASETVTVPEPSSASMALLAMGALGLHRRRNKS